MKYPKLFAPGQIGKVQLRNRAVMMPMSSNLVENDGTPGEHMRRYYAERARGGIGLIIVEAAGVDRETSCLAARDLLIDADYTTIAHARMTEAVHRHGAKIFSQLLHSGAIANIKYNKSPILAPSDVPAGPGRPVPQPTLDDIHRIEDKFIQAACRAAKAGYDGVEIHAAHGNLMTEMLSPHYNKRTDAYGGSFENRMRMITEIIGGIRQEVGAGFALSVRMSGDEMSPWLEDMMDLGYGLRVAKYLESLGIDCLNVSNGSAVFPNGNCEPFSYQPGWKKHIAKAYTAALEIPVIATNTIKTPAFAESLLEEGVSDFVGLGRSLFADPAFMRKAREGREGEIRTCIGCMYCRERVIQNNLNVQCSVNPRLGCEADYAAPQQNGKGRPVAVVGAGPAGMEAAKILADRGFAVTIYEKEDRVGGWLHLADKPRFKENIQGLIDTMEQEVRDRGVTVRTGFDAAPEAVEADSHPIAVFLAAGADWIRPEIPGADKPFVCTPEAVLCGKAGLTGSAVVIGCGNTGLECAEMLLDRGVSVTMADMLDEAGKGIYPVIKNDLMGRILPSEPSILLRHKLLEVTDNGVLLEDMETGEQKAIQADTVCLSLGSAPVPGLYERFAAVFDRVIPVGSAEKDGRIHDATKTGFTKGFAFDA